MGITTLRGLAAALAAFALVACDAANSAGPPAPGPSPAAPASNAPSAATQAAARAEPADFAPPFAVEPGFEGQLYVESLSLIGANFGDVYIRFGRTTLEEVRKHLGEGERAQRGTAGEFEGWLCYTIPGRQRVWLMTNSAGDGEYINGVRAIADPEAAPNAKCPALPASYARLSFDPEVATLGANLAQVERRLGAAPSFEENWRVYTHDYAYRSNSLELMDLNKVAVRVEGGAVVGLEVSKVTLD